MSKKRRGHNLDAWFPQRPQGLHGTPTEPETSHQVRRAVRLGEQLVAALESTSGQVLFRPEFTTQMRLECVRRPSRTSLPDAGRGSPPKRVRRSGRPTLTARRGTDK
jgi:hypothetical protein